jgi:hypothetical protein
MLTKLSVLCILSNLIDFILIKRDVYETFRHIRDNGTESEGFVRESSFPCLPQYVRYWSVAFGA